MQIRKKILVVIFTILLFAAVLPSISGGVTAFAGEPDSAKKGSISITMECDKKMVPGGKVALYHVGSVTEEAGDYSYILTDSFWESGADLADISSADLAEELARYAKEYSLPRVEKDIGNDGKAEYSDLKAGLYLIVQSEAASGYCAAEPFLVSIPINENGVWIYVVDASPKIKLETEPGNGKTPPDSPIPSDPGTPAAIGSTLPQTGQLNWPVPALAVMGLIMFFSGWMLSFGKGKTDKK